MKTKQSLNWLNYSTNFINTIIIFTLIAMIFTGIDIQYISKKCLKQDNHKLKIIMTVLGHHIIATILNFGYLSNNKLFLSCFILGQIIVIIHWLTNKNKCFITQDLNRLCGYPDNRYFPEFFWLIGFKKQNWWNSWGYYLYYIIGLLIAVFKVIYIR